MAFFSLNTNTIFSAKEGLASDATAVTSKHNYKVRSIFVKPAPQSSVGPSSTSKLATIVVEPLDVVIPQRKSKSFPGGVKLFPLTRTTSSANLLRPPHVNYVESPPYKKQEDPWVLENVGDVNESSKEKSDCGVENLEDQSFDCSGSAPYKP